jgi:adenosine deaminase
MGLSSGKAGFAEAIEAGDRAWPAAFPKADRHCHSIFGASLQSIEAWAGEPIEPPPPRMADLDEMRKYSHRALYPRIYHRAGFEHTAESAILEAIEDGVRILEMSFDVNFIQFYGDGATGFIGFVQRLRGTSGERIDFRPEIGISKNRDPSPQVALARECVDSGVFRSIDLYGNERAQEPEAYEELYRRAASRGLKLKAHVGEFGDARHVERTLRALGLHEIQHGVAAAASPSLMTLLRAEGIRLNVCPSSSVALSAAEDLAHHPIRTLVRSGVRVSINSDDKTIFGKSVTDEYLGLFRAGTLTAAELDAIRVDSLRD